MDKTTWKLTLAYDGAEFHGWQIQPDTLNMPTIQAALADAIAAVTGERVLPQGAGRTDAGVHAVGQVASFSLAAPIPAENLQRALNRVLPAAIRVLATQTAATDFHARHSAIGKIYRYQVSLGPVCPPFLARYVACPRWSLDPVAMQQAAQLVLGEHDFTSFAASDPDRASRLRESASSRNERASAHPNVRRIDESIWSMTRLQPSFPSFDSEAEILTYSVQGNGFLHHMVRNLVGTFLDVGRGHVPPQAIGAILAGRDRTLAGPTAPASGLCLMQVLY